MSDSEARDGPAGGGVDEAIARSPKVDGDQLREARELLNELRKRGVSPATYEISSPYQKPSRDRKSVPRGGRHFA